MGVSHSTKKTFESGDFSVGEGGGGVVAIVMGARGETPGQLIEVPSGFGIYLQIN